MKAKKTTFRIAGAAGTHYEYAVDFDMAFTNYLAVGKLLGANKAHNILTDFVARSDQEDLIDDYGFMVQL